MTLLFLRSAVSFFSFCNSSHHPPGKHQQRHHAVMSINPKGTSITKTFVRDSKKYNTSSSKALDARRLPAFFTCSAKKTSEIGTRSRRETFNSFFIISSSILISGIFDLPGISHADDNVNANANANPNTNASTEDEYQFGNTKIVQITNPQTHLGLELTEEQIGNPSRTVLVVKSMDPSGMAAKQRIEQGYVLSGFSSRESLMERIKSGPYPFVLKFVNLAGAGDAFGDMGKPLVTAQDALNVAKTNTDTSTDSLANDGVSPTRSSTSSSNSYSVTTLRKSKEEKIKSRRGDVLEIHYTASYYFSNTHGENSDVNSNSDKKVYDSSFQRGTGLPYQLVLGSGDMIPGVDQGLYDMYPGEVRVLDIPMRLGYGERGNKVFRIPGGARLYWTVELIAVNTVREFDGRTREDMNY